ncbi:MAG TPA: DUF2911 domain-containing protein, partial [Bryobacteraceae bacterium]|nr:DUF2911 domain-containing protein [Bryobacteraceae bacterium]
PTGIMPHFYWESNRTAPSSSIPTIAVAAIVKGMTRRTALLIAAAIPVAPYASAFQETRVSPHETASIDLAGKQITISYGRPYLKNRQFGKDVSPYGEVWRLGADEATKLTVPSTTKVEHGPELPAGSYSLWAIPGADKWTMIINKQADVWGTRYDQSQDLARFDLPVQKVAPVEEFTISLTKKSDRSAEVSFAWGTQMVRTTLTLG